MVNFDSLPPEIQSLIFQQIDSKIQLGECRLVNRKWDDLAERALFSKMLRITERNSTALYMHLSRKPVRAHLIKEIQFVCRNFTDSMAQLLPLVITPSIQKIRFYDDHVSMHIYQTLVQMIHGSGMKFQHLKSIPSPTFFTPIYYQVALLLKDSLEEFTIPSIAEDGGPHDETPQLLKELKCLSMLCIGHDCRLESLSQAERIFRSVPHVKEIVVYGCIHDEQNLWLAEEERLIWMKQNVEINSSAITLLASGYTFQSSLLLEYFLYKYPNIRHLRYHAEWYEDGVPEINTQACLWIREIPNYSLELSKQHAWRPRYGYFAGLENKFLLRYGQKEGYENCIESKLEQGQKRSTYFIFNIEDLSDDQSINSHINLLKDISAFTTELELNFVDAGYSGRDLISEMVSRVFFKSLEVMKHLKRMHINLHGNIEAMELDLSPQYEKRQLNTLKIINADVEPAAFDTLDRLFHTINELTLSNCYIREEGTNTQSVHLPSTALRTLTLEPYLGNSRILNAIYIMLNLQQENTLYFMLLPFDSDAHQLSSVEYFNRPRLSTAVYISCRLIARIEFDDICRKFRASIDVEHYRLSRNSAFKDSMV